MLSNGLELRPVSGAVGAEIHGVDLAEPIMDETLNTIRDTLSDRGVVFFRDQWLTPEQHIAFARRFGNINLNRFFAHADGYPEIALVVKEPHQTKNVGGGWHTDHSYDQEPALGSILYAREVPQSGGDNLFASMYAAYEALSDLGFEGWTEDESRPLLDYLYRHAVKPEFTCRFQWRKGSLAFWDNRATLCRE
jgi:taurine dioxygenase